MGYQVHYVTTCKSYKVSERPLEAAAKAERLVVFDLELSELLDDFAEGHFPAIELNEPDTLNYLACCLDSLVFEYVNFLDEGPIPL